MKTAAIEHPHEWRIWQRSQADERVNAATHAMGLMLAVTGAFVMARTVLGGRDVMSLVGCCTYLISLIAVYAMSTLSHTATSLHWKRFFRRLDQGAIFLLIAATYTPFSIAYLPSLPWWLLLSAVWGVALYGFVSKVFFAHRVDFVSVAPYVILGWMPVISAPSMLQAMPLHVFWWMLVGGVCYTVGTLFLIFDGRVRHFHAVWHVCVIAGSACHYCGILFCLADSSVSMA